MSKGRILVVEDDFDISNLLRIYFDSQGYEVTVAPKGNDALDLCRRNLPNVIVLDIQLPDIDGYEVCRRLRGNLRTSHIPILFLTQRDERSDKIAGLELGADDYITKPFSMRELLARVKAQLRRASFAQQEAPDAARLPAADRLVFGDLSIDVDRREAALQGEPLHLKPKEYDLLLFLARNRNMALSRDLILERVWGWDYDGGTRTVDVHVRWLREKIEEDPANPTRIVTVRGVGYRFET